MAYIVPKKKLNRFRNVSVPSNKDLFFRVGRRPVPDFQDGQVANFDSSTMGILDEQLMQALNQLDKERENNH